MKFLHLRILLSLVLAFGFCLVSYADEGQDKAAINQGTKVVEEALSGTILNGVTASKKGLDKFEKDFNAAAKNGTVKPEAIGNLQPAKVIAEARTDLDLAEQYRQLALQKIEQAKSASNPAMAQVDLKDAMDKAEMAQKLASRASSVLAEQPREQAQESHAIPTLNIKDTWHSLEQLKTAAKLSEEGYAPAAFGDYRQDSTGYDPSNQTLTRPDGRTIDVQYLQGTFTPSSNKQPLFKEVPSPVDGKPAVEASDSLREAVSSSDPEVGGVALKVTLDLLSFFKVPGFTKRGPATVVESPVLISLSELYAQVLPYSDKWNELPEGLRYPGNVERLIGFVLDPKHKDIFLVGAPAKSPETRLDIDTLIVGLQTVWRDGQTPAVSLDPSPENPGGPQYARVLGTPRDSVFAQIMLDADYAMKRMMCYDMTVDANGFAKTYAQIDSAHYGPDAPDRFSRFWFFPTPLGAGDISVSESARTVIFDSGVRLLTAQMQVSGGVLVDNGVKDEIGEKEAELFTKYYEQFERSQEIQPRGIYVRLHGLVDIVSICKLLRDMGIDYQIAHDFSSLPYIKCPVPNHYRGLTHTFGADGHEGFVSGGVHLRPRAGDHSLEWTRDNATMSLEHVVDTFPHGNGFSTTISVKLTLPRPGPDNGRTAENLMIQGHAALALKQYEVARARFQEATESDPFYTDAFAQLGATYSLMGKPREAAAAIAKAIALAPGDKDLETTALDIEMRADPEMDLSGKDESVRQALSTDYTGTAFSYLHARQNEDAQKKAGMAIRLWADNADAYYLRGTANLLTAHFDNALKDLLVARKIYKRESNTPRLAVALMLSALARRAELEKEFSLVSVSSAVEELDRASDEAAEALKLDSTLDSAREQHVAARAAKIAFLEASGVSVQWDGVQAAADEFVTNSPESDDAYLGRATVYALRRNFPKAIEDLTTALKLNPSRLESYRLRGSAFHIQGNFDKAVEDFQTALKLAPADWGYRTIIEAQLKKAQRNEKP